MLVEGSAREVRQSVSGSPPVPTAKRAGANRAMVEGVATDPDTTNTGSRAADARIDTLIAMASLIGITILFPIKLESFQNAFLVK